MKLKKVQVQWVAFPLKAQILVCDDLIGRIALTHVMHNAVGTQRV